MPKTVFDDALTSAALAAAGVSSVLGPGRLARCREVSFSVHFGTTCTAGQVDIQASHHQDFPGVPQVLASAVAPGAGNETVQVNLTGVYRFLRCVASAGINGNGVESIQAMGN